MGDEGSRLRVLIVRLGALGDLVHTIPVAAALRAHFPEAQIDWMVDPRYVDLLRLVPAVDRAVPVNPRRQWKTLLATLGGLRHTRYDAAIDLQGLLKSAVLARAAGAMRTIGFASAELREPAARIFYTETQTPAGDVHVIHKNLSLLRAFGIYGAPTTFPIADVQSAMADLVAAGGGSSGRALLAPGAGWPNKRWPPERFGALAAALRDRLGVRSLVLWGPGEQPLASAVVAASSGAAEPAPPTTIADLVAIARTAAVIVGGDTGPVQVAAAVGTPVVALFGPSRAERNGPWSDADVIVDRTSDCVCLYERRCRRGRPCLDDIAVDEVTDAVVRRLATRHEGR